MADYRLARRRFSNRLTDCSCAQSYLLNFGCRQFLSIVGLILGNCRWGGRVLNGGKRPKATIRGVLG